jgi:hypothetical protein
VSLKSCEDTDGGGVDWGDCVEDPLDEGKCDDSKPDGNNSPGETGWYGGGEVHCEDGCGEGDNAFIALGEGDLDGGSELNEAILCEE